MTDIVQAKLEELLKLHKESRVHAYRTGPPPKLILKLMKTNPIIWHVRLIPFDQAGETHFAIVSILALEEGHHHIKDSDLENVIKILGSYFYASDSSKIQLGRNFGGPFKVRPKMIFLFWGLS